MDLVCSILEIQAGVMVIILHQLFSCSASYDPWIIRRFLGIAGSTNAETERVSYFCYCAERCKNVFAVRLALEKKKLTWYIIGKR